ncbi:MAG: ABC transporter substrate-binding protein [Holosporaceae bacterium]|jgi:trehalose/maltose transport system substrate-binding protein|nr:ABC transporter substrate-binding protein [Holosporaceae bacterium]
MKIYLKLLTVFAAAFLCFFDANCATIKIACKAKGREAELIEKATKEWMKSYKGEHSVEIITLPRASNECLALYLQWLSAETFDVDILQVDLAWIGMLADYLHPLDEFLSEEEADVSDYFPVIKKHIYHNGKIVVLPWYADCGVMYYRTDLLQKYGKPVPQSWEELHEIALYIQNEERKDPLKRNKFYGLGFPAKAFEELTCSFLELVDSFGGAIIKDGKVIVNSNECVKAVKFLVHSFGSIINRGAVNHSGEEIRGLFQSGNSVFMRNWPYAWSLMNEQTAEVAGKIGVIPIPPSAKGGKPSGTLGGWSLAVSKYSKHPHISADLAKFMTSKEQQRVRSEFSYLPARASLYRDSKVLENNPFLGYMYKPLRNSVARPSKIFGKNYQRASTEIFNAINTIITESVESENFQEKDIKKYLDRLARKLNKILEKTSPPPVSKKKVSLPKGEGFLYRIKKFFGLSN